MEDFKDPQLKLRAKMFVTVAEKLPAFVDEVERVHDEEEDIGVGGYTPMLCPSCTRFLDHISVWRHLTDNVLVHKLKCGHCDLVVNMLIHCEAIMTNNRTGIGLGKAVNPNHPDEE